MSRHAIQLLPPGPPERQADVSPSSAAGERSRLATLAAEFESALMLEMIKQMRRSMLEEEAEGKGLGGDTFSSTIDTELARHLSHGGGLGLQAELLQAWDRQRGTGEPALEVGTPEPTAVVTAGPVALSTSASAHRPAGGVTRPDHGGHDGNLGLDMDATVSSQFGWRRDPLHGRARFHGGIDLAARYGTEVPSAAEGTVVTAGEQGGYGLTVVVRHAGGYETRYAHLSSLDVSAGDAIGKGTVLGRVGSSGRSTAPHLHFEVSHGGQRVDPDRFVRNLTGDIKGQ